MSELDRRHFMKLVGLSAGAAAAAGCSDPVEKLVPYVIQPEVITPGIAVEYASTCTECPSNCGLHVKTREARPIKLDGNPNHPINGSAICARGQAAIARPYLPQRYEGPMQRSADGSFQKASWDVAQAAMVAKVGAKGARTVVLRRPGGADAIGRYRRVGDSRSREAGGLRAVCLRVSP